MRLPALQAAAARALVIILLLGVLYTSSGLSLTWMMLPARASQAVADGGDYPCAGHACGCASREACLAHCCCFGRPGDTANVPAAPADDASTGLTLRSSQCAGSAPWLMVAARLAWLAGPEMARPTDGPWVCDVTLRCDQSPTSRALPVMAPPPRG